MNEMSGGGGGGNNHGDDEFLCNAVLVISV
jgi:hypothetical protein